MRYTLPLHIVLHYEKILSPSIHSTMSALAALQRVVLHTTHTTHLCHVGCHKCTSSKNSTANSLLQCTVRLRHYLPQPGFTRREELFLVADDDFAGTSVPLDTVKRGSAGGVALLLADGDDTAGGVAAFLLTEGNDEAFVVLPAAILDISIFSSLGEE